MEGHLNTKAFIAKFNQASNESNPFLGIYINSSLVWIVWPILTQNKNFISQKKSFWFLKKKKYKSDKILLIVTLFSDIILFFHSSRIKKIQKKKLIKLRRKAPINWISFWTSSFLQPFNFFSSQLFVRWLIEFFFSFVHFI